jgi:hypothetical protein
MKGAKRLICGLAALALGACSGSHGDTGPTGGTGAGAAPSIGYPRTSYTFTVGNAIAPNAELDGGSRSDVVGRPGAAGRFEP